MHKLEAIRRDEGYPAKPFTIEEETQDKAFGTYFREHVNRFKYCNSVYFTLTTDEDREAYDVWMSDISNYANNGGDMW